MINSMTGYGKGSAEKGSTTAEVEIKSVNSRYLDLFLKLPITLQSKEYEIREILKTRIKRGKITLTAQIKKDLSDDEETEIDKGKLHNFLGLVEDMKEIAHIEEKIGLRELLENKELFLKTESETPEEDFELTKLAIQKALGELLVMKKNEGDELRKDILKRSAIIEEKLNIIEGESEVSVNENFEKLKEKVKALIKDISEYSDRLELELAIIAEKGDITEECVRLRSHLKFLKESIENDDEPGRKLNFLCQEMNREANTISSKSVSIKITHHSVLIKEEIEKIREQIQNIE
jgi:uncharacterized protein (TIGR00255 family)